MGRFAGINYTDEQKTAALVAYDVCDNNAVHAATYCQNHYKFKVSHDQITRWSRGEYIAESVRNNAKRIKGQLADKCEQVAHLCYDMLPDKLPETSARDLAAIGNIAVNNMRLLREQATTITNAQITDEDRLRELQELMQRLRQRQIEAQQGQVIDIESEEKTD